MSQARCVTFDCAYNYTSLTRKIIHSLIWTGEERTKTYQYTPLEWIVWYYLFFCTWGSWFAKEVSHFFIHFYSYLSTMIFFLMNYFCAIKVKPSKITLFLVMQPTPVALSHARIAVSVLKWAQTRMNVTVHALDFTVKTAQHVRENCIDFCKRISFLFSVNTRLTFFTLVSFYSRVSHMG